MNLRNSVLFISGLFLLLGLTGLPSYGQGIDSNRVKEVNGKKYIFHEVEKGNTLYSISRQYEVSVDDIIAENPAARSGLSIGQVLRIPLPDRREELKRKIELDGNYIAHEVITGQTLFGISQIYNVEINDIVAENPTVVYGIKPGDLLRIPINKIKKEKPPKFDVTKDQWMDYEVKPKETLFSISQKYHVTIDEIKQINNGLVDGLKEGQLINVPLKLEGVTAPSALLPNDSDELLIKDRYKIAVFLPLYLAVNDSLESNVSEDDERMYGDRNTAAALKFYQGIKMALDSMGKQGFKATLHVYDTENDLELVNGLLNKPEMKEMDLFIGPLYPALFETVSAYAKKNGINIVSPINPSNRPLLGNPYLIKVVTSKTTQASDLARFMAGQHRHENIITLKKDLGTDNLVETFVNAYRENIELINDTSVVAPAVEFGFSSSTKQEELKAILRKDTQNYVFVPSTDKVFVTEVIRKLNGLAKEYPISVIGMEEWLKFENIDIDYFSHLNLHLITWNYIDFENEKTRKFVDAYYKNFKSFPGEYAIRGFDVSYYIFSLMKNYGNSFRSYMERNPATVCSHSFRFCQTAIESGYENQSLVILKLEDYKLVRVK